MRCIFPAWSASAIALAIALIPDARSDVKVTSADASIHRVQYDVPYVPTPQTAVEEMLKLARVGPNDYVIDLGSGDGRIVLTAVQKFGARGLGVDLDPEHIAASRKAAKEANISDRAKFIQEDLFKVDLSRATVVTLYLLPGVNMKLRPRLLSELRPGTRVVSHAFDMDDWKPDQQLTTAGGQTLYRWIIPAKVEGSWTVKTAPRQEPMQLTLQQKFQMVEGSARIGNRKVPLTDAKLDGDQLTFALPGENGKSPRKFVGRVSESSIQGQIIPAGSERPVATWSASRVDRAA